MRLLLLLLPWLLCAQTPVEFIGVNFTRQDVMIGYLQVYLANVCNNGPISATIQSGRDVWPAAEKKGILLQGPVAVLKAEQQDTTKSKRAWVLWGLAGGCAIASGVTNGGAVSLDPAKGIGKAVAYGTAGCAIGLPIVAETIRRAPSVEVNIPDSERLQPTFVVGAGDCKQGYVFAVVPFGLKAAP